MVSEKNKAGMQLLLMLTQCLDRLHLLPTSCNHTIVLGAHVQCLTLKLWGYVNYYSVIVSRLETPTLHGSADWDILPVRGAFTNDVSVTQSLFCIGVLFRFIQMKTDKMRIKKWAFPVPISNELSLEMSWSCLLRNETNLAGILNCPGDWPSRMLHEATNAVCDVQLPPLKGASESSSAEQPPQKKQKNDKQLSVQQGDGNVKSQASHSVAESSKKSKQSHCGMRGKKNHHVEGSSMETSQPAHLSLVHECSTLIGAAWNTALSAVPPLAAPARVATYFFPPPFMLGCSSDKLRWYLHNFVRIHRFCHQRILDPTIGGLPLKIVKWCDALWGDYSLDEAVDGGSAITVSRSVDASVEGEMGVTEGPIRTSDATGPMSQVNSASKTGSAKKVKDRHERQQNIHHLFTATGRMSSYIETAQPHFGMDLISVDDVDELCEKLLWEVHETNWHCELHALDAHLLDMSKWSSMHHWEREAQLAKVWDKRDSGSGLTFTPCWNSHDVVFCWVRAPAQGWLPCKKFLAAFIAVMQRWPELPEGLRLDARKVLAYEADKYNLLQENIVRFYVTTFVHHFHHLPITPIQYA
ncbi:hypothetical protein SCP_0603560 [Sparassis crispa]|uniref:Uncharacterized protein n=1 Tax=Sparassis crispa TaxID=139825 RepID=A0A401GQ78_9APHY|nr:hypothetical protein SCP_0603560 [Sparassis crispa]GBE84377.1 hypothetical protein SCP_0603560 [Sparassis crispa]